MEALRSTQARILVTDISLGKESGLSLVETIKKTMPHVSSLVVSVHDEEQFAPRAYHAGAAGYVTKDSGLGDLLKALNRIADGGAYISREFRPRVVQMLREHNKERRSA